MDHNPEQSSATLEFTVSQVSRRVKELLDGAAGLTGIWVKGEVSNVRLAGSGHLYFTLKDAASQLRCAYFNFGRGKRKPPADGTAVLTHGDVRVYERGGEYQLIADDLIKAGVGDLAAQFEALKQKLAAEGLFDETRKITPPAVPRRIAVVTGIATAALQDVLNVLRRRAPYISVVLFPTAVQGLGAPAEIIAALGAADACPGVELILLVRGGGSLEDLWCFNDELLARALAEIKRPVITGIGHEIDFTIADFVADHRAPTPSAAAELAAPDALELRTAAAQAGRRLARAVKQRFDASRADAARLFDKRLLRDVVGSVETRQLGLDELALRLVETAAERTQLNASAPGREYGALLERIAAPVKRRLAALDLALPRESDDLLRAVRLRLEEAAAQVRAAKAHLGGHDPRAPKKLGFALVWQADGTLVRDPAQVALGEGLTVEVRDGSLRVVRE